MNKQRLNQWGIEARAFRIRYIPFTHNFWVLTNSNHTVIDQIHGLAVNPETKETKAIGNSSDLLQAIHDSNIIWSLQQGQPIVSCAVSCETEIKQRWQSALNAIPAINALEIRYPNLLQHIYKKNSNTIFNTMGKIMDLPVPALSMPGCSPGIHLIISVDIINQYCYKPS